MKIVINERSCRKIENLFFAFLDGNHLHRKCSFFCFSGSQQEESFWVGNNSFNNTLALNSNTFQFRRIVNIPFHCLMLFNSMRTNGMTSNSGIRWKEKTWKWIQWMLKMDCCCCWTYPYHRFYIVEYLEEDKVLPTHKTNNNMRLIQPSFKAESKKWAQSVRWHRLSTDAIYEKSSTPGL